MARFLLLAILLAVLVGMSTAQTFCEKYSGSTTNATLQTNLITAVVVRAVTGGIYTSPSNQTVQVNGLFNASGPLYNIFAGITQYRTNPPNYTNDTTALGTLAGKLVAYFGALFGCNAPGYPQPAVTNMYAVHRNMNITNTQETYFNTALANTLASFGVATADLQAAGTVLGWFNKCGAPLGGNLGNGTAGLLQICGASDCPTAGNANYSTCITYYGAATSSSSSTGTAVTPTSIYPTGSFLVPLTVNLPSNLTAAVAVPLIRQDIAVNIANVSSITNSTLVLPYVLIQSFNNTAFAPASRRLLQITANIPVTFILLGNITQLGGNAANTATVVNNFKAAAAAGTLVAPNSGGSIPVQTVNPVVPGAYSSSSSAGSYTSSTGNGATGRYAGGLIVAVASVLASLLL